MGGRKPLTLKYCIDIAKEHDGECLESVYINSETKMMWKCREGHTWAANMNSVGQGRWCKICGIKTSAKKRGKSIGDCVKAASMHNGKCLSTEYVNNSTRMEWQCEFGHIWRTTANSIFQGSWCAACLGSKRLTLEDCQRAAAEHNGKCLATEYVNAKTRIQWVCNNGHTWFGSLNRVKQGHWCLECSGSKKKTIDDCRQLAISKSGRCLSISYVNGDAHLIWQCDKGHKWSASFDNVNRGTWCNVCKYHKTQRLLADLIADITGSLVLQGYRQFDWLKTTGGRLEIDIWVPEFKLAVEYDGAQHFKPVRFGGVSEKKAKENFKKQQKRDRAKNNKIYKHKDDVLFFVRFSYKEYITKEYVIEKLNKVGLCIDNKRNIKDV